MSYQINYDPSRKRKFYTANNKRVPNWLLVATGVAIAACIFNKELKALLIPGDPQVTSAAFSALTDNIKEGDSLKDAVTAFCREVIDGAAAQN